MFWVPSSQCKRQNAGSRSMNKLPDQPREICNLQWKIPGCQQKAQLDSFFLLRMSKRIVSTPLQNSAKVLILKGLDSWGPPMQWHPTFFFSGSKMVRSHSCVTVQDSSQFSCCSDSFFQNSDVKKESRICTRNQKMYFQQSLVGTVFFSWGKPWKTKVSCRFSTWNNPLQTDIPRGALNIFAVLLFGRVRLALCLKVSCDARQMWQFLGKLGKPNLNLCG